MQSEILLVCQPASGLGYQMIAALHRLGVKAMVPAGITDESLAPLQVIHADHTSQEYSAALYSPAALDVATLREDLAALPETVHAVAVLPSSIAPREAEQLLHAHLATTLILVPTLVGFRDNDFFASMVEALRHQNGKAWELLKSEPDFDGIWIDDVCGFLVSTLWQSRFHQRVLIAPATKFSPREIVEAFENELEFHSSAFERLTLRFSKTAAAHKTRTSHTDFKTLLSTMPAASDLLQELPTAVTSMTAWVKKVSGHLEREPDSDLHFPPTRAP